MGERNGKNKRHDRKMNMLDGIEDVQKDLRARPRNGDKIGAHCSSLVGARVKKDAPGRGRRFVKEFVKEDH